MLTKNISFAISIAVIVTTFFGCSVKQNLSSADAPKPNILWIFSEDLSPFMGCYGDTINADHTPTIDGLAAEGILFKQAFATAPVCSASRSAIITGVMQTTTGTHQHRSSRTTDGEVVPEPLRIHLPEEITTIPELMRQAGYFTFNSGKDDYNFHYDRRELYSAGTKEDYQAGMNGWQGNTSKEKVSFTQDTWNARTDKDQPWFGQVMLLGGKSRNKYVKEDQKLGRNDVPMPVYFPNIRGQRASWTEHYNAVRGTDHRVQELLSQLKADGELENTIIFFFSDHGSNQSLRHKQFCYEGGVHVPLIIKGNHPAIKAGAVRNDLVSTLDISATTLELGGVSIPNYFDGQSLFDKKNKSREYIISARDRCDYTIDRIRTVRTNDFRYIHNYFPERPRLQAQYRDKSKAVQAFRQAHKDGKLTPYQEEHWFGTRAVEELYDLKSDPHQMNNLAALPEFSAEVSRHRNILDQWIKEHGDTGQTPEAAVHLEATYNLWKDRAVFINGKTNPEYDQFR